MRLAIHGGTPVRHEMLPYARQAVSREDIEAVTAVLNSSFLTTGPLVDAFEEAIASYTQTKYAVAVSSGTAALHAAVHALGIGSGDEVIVPAITFVATANCVVYQGATPVFADVDPETLLIDVNSVREKITPRTRAIIAVDYAGQPCHYTALKQLANLHNLKLICDASHSLGSSYHGQKTGSIANITTFSFHPVKHITTGEGGIITTNDTILAKRMRRFRNHGLNHDHKQRSEKCSWSYEMEVLGFNYRITDIQCALGLSQLNKLDQWIDARKTIADIYDAAFSNKTYLTPLKTHEKVNHAHHLYVIRLNTSRLSNDRDEIFSAMRAEGIGVNVHYMPIYRHPYYIDRFGKQSEQYPNSEMVYQQILSLPLFPMMSEKDVQDVISAIQKVCAHYEIG